MNLPGRIAMSYGAQIDYLQTCWGDQEVQLFAFHRLVYRS